MFPKFPFAALLPERFSENLTQLEQNKDTESSPSTAADCPRECTRVCAREGTGSVTSSRGKMN